MALPKRSEIIIKNLNSIFAEVRQKALIQLYELSEISSEEKIAHFRKATKDEDENVRSTAVRLLSAMGVSANPETSLSQTSPPQHSSAAFPSNFSSTTQTNSQVSNTLKLANVSEITANQIDEDNTQIEDIENLKIEAPDLDDPVDPALPSLESLKSIPQKLDHIKYLTRERPPGHITHLLVLAEDQVEEVSLTALQTLLKLKDPRVPPQVLPMLAIPGFSSQRRFLILKILMETKSNLEPKYVEAILLREKDVIVKSGLVKVFARLAGNSGVKTLRKCLFDEDPRVRANTVEVIEEQNIYGCDDDIAKLLSDPENRVKVNTAKFLVKRGYPQAFQTLKSMLGSSEVWLRDSVIFALGEIGDQASLTLLKAALKDPNQGIRLSVLKALAKINNAAAREALQGATNDSDPVVSQVAKGLWEKIKDTPISQPVAQKPPSAQPSPPTVQPSPPPSQSQTPNVALQTKIDTIKPTHEHEAVSQKPQSPLPITPKSPIPQTLEKSTTTSSVSPQPQGPLSSTKLSSVVSQPNFPSVKSPIPTTTVSPSPPPPPPVNLPEGMPAFQKPRSAEIYARLCSGDPSQIQIAMKDLPFIAGDDQLILLAKAIEIPDDNQRLNAAKILSRKRGPAAIKLMSTLVNDSNPIISDFAKKALMMMK